MMNGLMLKVGISNFTFAAFWSNCPNTSFCTAGVHNLSLPEANRIDFKLHAEKAKKFDELVTEFPTNLATPVDVSYIRLIVRRIRNNKAKQVANKNKATVTNSSPANVTTQEKAKPIAVKEEKKVMASVKLDAPQKGTVFAAVVLDRSQFNSWYLLSFLVFTEKIHG